MSDAASFDFSKLVSEATSEAYDPRARRCWPWSHAWTMWQENPCDASQSRRCTACGLVSVCRTGAKPVHDWATERQGNILNGRKQPIGTYKEQRCTMCAEFRILKKTT